MTFAPPEAGTPASSLSGGNQQKIVVARALHSHPEWIVAVNPTRGLDIGATRFVHAQLRQAQARGAAIVLISTDLDELALLSTRQAILSGGVLTPFTGAMQNTTQIGLLLGGIQEPATVSDMDEQPDPSAFPLSPATAGKEVDILVPLPLSRRLLFSSLRVLGYAVGITLLLVVTFVLLGVPPGKALLGMWIGAVGQYGGWALVRRFRNPRKNVAPAAHKPGRCGCMAGGHVQHRRRGATAHGRACRRRRREIRRMAAAAAADPCSCFSPGLSVAQYGGA